MTPSSAACVLAAACGFAAALVAQAPAPSAQGRSDLAPLVAASLEVARTGNAGASRTMLEVLAALELPAKELDTHRAAVDRELRRAKKGSPTARACKLVHDAAEVLARRLPALTGDPARHFAALLLRLDAELPPAHTVLGHELHDGRWHPAGEDRRATGRAAFATAIQRARNLDIAIESGPSDNELLTAALGRPGVRARHGKLELHSCYSVAKTERILRQTVRAAALVNWLVTGEVAVPDYGQQRSLLFATRQQFQDVLGKLVARGEVSAEIVDSARNVQSWRFMQLVPMLQVGYMDMEVDIEANWLATLEYWRGRFPCLIAGRVDLAARLLLGCPYPSMVEVVMRPRSSGGAGTRAEDAAAAAERARYAVLTAAGLHGGRAWMRYLVREREAPPWRATMHDQVATLAGDELLKATLVVELLVEEGRFKGLAEAAEAAGKVPQAEALERALGESTEEVDRRFGEWLIGLADGVVQELEPEPAPSPDRVAATNVLAAVRALRERAGLRDPLELDDELAAGCRAHAAYLLQNEDQTRNWPAAHEEYPDHPGWTAAGSMAGRAAVIAPGCKTDEQALASWMATFYHRVPLLHPGLRRIGYAREGGIAVLDCGSMVAPRPDLLDVVVTWPHDGMTATPTRFAPELPNPVPDEDQTKFGYPITMQFMRRSSQRAVDLRMVLREGQGPEVPCWFSSPQAPSNPVLAPADVFCLIPKAPLKKGTTYSVEATLLGEGAVVRWTFKT